MKVEVKRSAQKQIDKLPKDVASVIRTKIKELKSTTEKAGKIQSEKLTGTKDCYKIRIGNYRMVYQKITSNHILVTSVKDRKDIYKKLFGLTFSL